MAGSSRPLDSSGTTLSTGRTFPTGVGAPILLEGMQITGRVRPLLVIHRFQALLASTQADVGLRSCGVPELGSRDATALVDRAADAALVGFVVVLRGRAQARGQCSGHVLDACPRPRTPR